MALLKVVNHHAKRREGVTDCKGVPVGGSLVGNTAGVAEIFKTDNPLVLHKMALLSKIKASVFEVSTSFSIDASKEGMIIH